MKPVNRVEIQVRISRHSSWNQFTLGQVFQIVTDEDQELFEVLGEINSELKRIRARHRARPDPERRGLQDDGDREPAPPETAEEKTERLKKRRAFLEQLAREDEQKRARRARRFVGGNQDADQVTDQAGQVS